MVAYICNSRAWEVKTENQGGQGLPWIHNKLKASLGYIIGRYVKKQNQKAIKLPISYAIKYYDYNSQLEGFLSFSLSFFLASWISISFPLKYVSLRNLCLCFIIIRDFCLRFQVVCCLRFISLLFYFYCFCFFRKSQLVHGISVAVSDS